MKRAAYGFLKVIDTICLTMFITMVICAVLQVLFRYVLKVSVPMTEEFARLLSTLTIFMALILVEAEDGQLKTSFLLEKMPYTAKWILYGIINIASAIFVCSMGYGAILMFQSSGSMTYGTMPWLSSSITYIPVIICAPFVVIALIARIILFKDTIIGKSGSYTVDDKGGDDE